MRANRYQITTTAWLSVAIRIQTQAINFRCSCLEMQLDHALDYLLLLVTYNACGLGSRYLLYF